MRQRLRSLAFIGMPAGQQPLRTTSQANKSRWLRNRTTHLSSAGDARTAEQSEQRGWGGWKWDDGRGSLAAHWTSLIGGESTVLALRSFETFKRGDGRRPWQNVNREKENGHLNFESASIPWWWRARLRSRGASCLRVALTNEGHGQVAVPALFIFACSCGCAASSGHAVSHRRRQACHVF